MYAQRALLSFVALFIFAPTSFAQNIVGGQAPAITRDQTDTATHAAILERCSQLGFRDRNSKSKCIEMANESGFAKDGANRCLQEPKTDNAINCLAGIRNRDVPVSYMQACRKKDIWTLKDSNDCIDYLAKSRSSFDPELFALCLSKSKGNMTNAKACLNSIRDRQVNVQKVEANCKESLSMLPRFPECVEEVAEAAPLIANCGTTPPASRASTSATVK